MTEYQKKELKKLIDSYQYKLSIAESLTSGIIQSYIGSISGSSTFYVGGVTTYTIDSKHKFLGVDKTHAFEVNAVSERVVKEMSEGVCNLFETNIGISTTGYAEPSRNYGIDTPFAFISVFFKDENHMISRRVIGNNLNRNEMRKLVANEAIKLLLEELLKFDKKKSSK